MCWLPIQWYNAKVMQNCLHTTKSMQIYRWDQREKETEEDQSLSLEGHQVRVYMKDHRIWVSARVEGKAPSCCAAKSMAHEDRQEIHAIDWAYGCREVKKGQGRWQLAWSHSRTCHRQVLRSESLWCQTGEDLGGRSGWKSKKIQASKTSFQ